MAVIHFVSVVTHSSPLNSISCWYRISCIVNSPVTLKRWRVGGEWINLVNLTFSTRYKALGWWVGDECFEMNHRCNHKSHNNLQRWGWRVDELYENSFFKSVVSHHVRVWRLIQKKAKADFTMSGLQVHFFARVFVEGGALLPLFEYNTLIINRK